MPKKPTKPTEKKPYPEFPLFRHQSGQWAKKIRGKLVYFGVVADTALQKYLDSKDDLHAGRKPRKRDGLTLADLCNHYLTAKKQSVDTGELSPRTFADLHRVCTNLINIVGGNRLVDDLGADDFATLRFELAKVRGAVSLGNEVQRIRSVFKFAYDDNLIDRPVRFGASFKKPNRKSIRQARGERGSRMIEAAELRSILDAVRNPLKAMVLLGINCGFGQSDVARLPITAIDFDKGWIDFARAKTAISRRIPLWQETAAALTDAIRDRPKPKDDKDAGLTFITKYGHPWVRTNFKGDDKEKEVPIDSVRLEYNKVLTRLGLKRSGGFYNLRHCFRTVADSCRDFPAIDAVMGHTREGDMSDFYRERIDDSRLVAVVEHVRRWLFAE